MAAMATLWALPSDLDCATVRLECLRGAWYPRWTLPSVRQNWVNVAVSTPRFFILLSVQTSLEALELLSGEQTCKTTIFLNKQDWGPNNFTEQMPKLQQK